MRSTELVARLRLDASQFERSISQSQSSLQQFSRASAALPGGRGSVFGQLAADAGALTPLLGSLPLGIAAVGASMVALGVSAQRSGQAFEFALSRLKTLGEEAKANLGTVRAGILDTFSNIPVAEGLNDIVEANYELQSSGRSAAQSIKDTEVAAKAAVAGFTTTRVAVDGITTATNAWKGSIDSAEEASDILFVGVNRGKVRFDELAASIGNVAPTASAMNVSFEETVGAIAALSLQGVRTSTAVEGIRSALINIQAPTEAFKRDYKGLAGDFDASRLARDGLLKFLRDFDEQSGGSRDALKALFSDTTAFNSALGLLANGGTVYASILDEMTRASGATQRGFNEVLTTSQAQEQLLRNRLTRAWTEFGENLNSGVLPTLTKVAEILAMISRNQVSTTDGFGGALVKAVKDGNELLDLLTGITLARKLLTENVVTPFRPSGGGPGANGLGMDSTLSGMTFLGALSPSTDIDLTTGGSIASAVQKPIPKPPTAEQLKAIAEAKARREKIVKDAAALLDELEAANTKALEGVAGTLQRAVAKTIAEVQVLLQSKDLGDETKAALTARLDSFVGLQKQLIDAEVAAVRTKEVLKQAGQEEELQAQRTIAAREVELELQLKVTTNREAQLRIETQLADLAAARGQMTGNVFDLPDSTTKNAEGLSAAILSAVDGAVALANAFEGVSSELRQTLANITLVARGALDIVKTIKQLRAGGTALSSGTGLLSLAGAALPLIGGLASLAQGVFGESEAEKQRKQVLLDNTAALLRLSENVGDLANLSVSGGAISRVGSFANRLIAETNRVPRPFGDPSGDGLRLTRAGYVEKGTTRAEVIEVAEALGVTLDSTVGSFRRLQERINALDFEAFAETFAGARQEVDERLRIDGVTDPGEVYRRTTAAIFDPKTGFPALATALQGIDLETVEGRNEAANRARAVYDDIVSGRVSPGQFGTLSFSEGRQAVSDFITSTIDRNKGDAAGTGGFNETRTITEVTGSRLAGLLGTGNTYLAQIAADIRAIAGALQIPTLPSFSPVSLPFGLGGGAGAAIVISGGISITVQLTLTADVLRSGAAGLSDAATRFGQGIGDAVMTSIDQQLRERALRKKLLTGDARLSR